jgi:hypothetical protein
MPRQAKANRIRRERRVGPDVIGLRIGMAPAQAREMFKS